MPRAGLSPPVAKPRVGSSLREVVEIQADLPQQEAAPRVAVHPRVVVKAPVDRERRAELRPRAELRQRAGLRQPAGLHQPVARRAWAEHLQPVPPKRGAPPQAHIENYVGFKIAQRAKLRANAAEVFGYFMATRIANTQATIARGPAIFATCSSRGEKRRKPPTNETDTPMRPSNIDER